ncbi:capsid maturation protease [Rhodobacter phage RcZahn]|nr:capsid maturation protease [Rhodobacter phage RcZahn]
MAQDKHKDSVGTPAAARAASIKKSDDELRIVWGEVYAPGFPDSQGDFMSADTVREMAYGFMKKQALNAIDTNHSRELNGSIIVESFIAREDDPLFIPGAWVIGVYVPDDTVWGMVKSGELNGFSIDGHGVRVEAVLEINMPEVLIGETDAGPDGHKHTFFVKFSVEGKFLGGETSRAEDGHYHVIKAGTCTEIAGDHSHRFSFVEGVLDAQIAA